MSQGTRVHKNRQNSWRSWQDPRAAALRTWAFSWGLLIIFFIPCHVKWDMGYDIDCVLPSTHIFLRQHSSPLKLTLPTSWVQALFSATCRITARISNIDRTQQYDPAVNSALHVIQFFIHPHLPSWLVWRTYWGLQSHTAAGRLSPAACSLPVLCSFSAISGGNTTKLHLVFMKILWQELWQLWSQSTHLSITNRSTENTKDQKQSQGQLSGRICSTWNQSWPAVQVCTCKYQKEPRVTSGQIISPEATWTGHK